MLSRRGAIAAFCGVAYGAGRRRRLPPVDESAADPSFARFLTTLRAIAAKSDTGGLRALCAPDVITGIDAPSGPAELVRKMESGGWNALREVLALGAARYEKGFVLPYLFEKFPEDLEAHEHAVTVRAGAVLRASARTDAAVVCPLDFDILRVDGLKPGAAWQQAARLDGPRGWVAAADIRTTGDPRLFCEKRAGLWRITAWAAGD